METVRYRCVVAISDNFYGIYDYVDKGVTAENYKEKVWHWTKDAWVYK